MSITRARAALYRLFSKGKIKIGSNARVGSGVTISPGEGTIRIGRDAKIEKGAILQTFGGEITIGDNFSLNPYSILYGHGGLSIGDNVRIAARVTVVPFNHNHDVSVR